MRWLALFSFLAALTLVVTAPGSAEPDSSKAAPPPGVADGDQTAAEDAPPIDEESVKALGRMAASLRTLGTFSVVVDSTLEDVLESGQKIQFDHQLTIRAIRPTKLRMDLVSDRKERQIFYDGKTLTVFSPKLGFFTTIDAPATIIETLKMAREKYGVVLPLTDLFTWGTDGAQEKDLTGAMFVGSDTIRGKSCEHYAFREPGLDWQVWIAKGEKALPCKMVITSTGDPAQPQYVAVMDWNPSATLDQSVFAFAPPGNSHKISIGVVDVADTSSN
jgi:hypothetical protein